MHLDGSTTASALILFADDLHSRMPLLPAFVARFHQSASMCLSPLAGNDFLVAIVVDERAAFLRTASDRMSLVPFHHLTDSARQWARSAEVFSRNLDVGALSLAFVLFRLGDRSIRDGGQLREARFVFANRPNGAHVTRRADGPHLAHPRRRAMRTDIVLAAVSGRTGVRQFGLFGLWQFNHRRRFGRRNCLGNRGHCFGDFRNDGGNQFHRRLRLRRDGDGCERFDFFHRSRRASDRGHRPDRHRLDLPRLHGRVSGNIIACDRLLLESGLGDLTLEIFQHHVALCGRDARQRRFHGDASIVCMLDQDFGVHPQLFRQGEDSHLERFVLGQLFGQRHPLCRKDE